MVDQVKEILEDKLLLEKAVRRHWEISDDPIFPTIEYFLSLENVSGFEKKRKDFLCKLSPKNRDEKNDVMQALESVFAEFGAMLLLGKELRLPIVGFDQISPKKESNKDFDIVAVLNGRPTFFEVKRNCREIKQSVPEKLKEALYSYSLELPYDFAVELKKRDYKWSDSNIEKLLGELKWYIAHIRSRLEARGLDMDQSISTFPTFVNSEIKVLFSEKSRIAPCMEFYDAVTIKDLRSFLLESGRMGKDGKEMVPMVKQAEKKGADYLICNVPGWDTFNEIVEGCFEELNFRNRLTFFTRDVRFGSLSGIVLFTKYDNFCIINNLQPRNQNWISV